VIAQYHEGNFAAYESLNRVIQKSIERARQIRSKGVISNASPLEEKTRPFAKTANELSQRIKKHAGAYFSLKKEQDSSLSEKLLVKEYEDQMRDVEDTYLFKDPQGNPLPQQEKENLFALHLLKSFASSLDSHTRVYNPDEAYQMKMRLERGFYGVGLILEKREGHIVVTKVVPGSPAQKSGKIKVNDKLIKVNDLQVLPDSVDQALQELGDSGKMGVTLRLEKEDGTQIELSLQKEPIAIDEDRVSTSTFPYGNGIIGVIGLNSFYQGENGITSERDVKQAIRDLQQKGNLKGLILDLRENSGGFLMQAVKVAGLFMTNGVVVVSKYADGKERVYRDMDGKVYFQGPMIVLTSKATASAAEIVAQSLQDWGVALVVGDSHTYGKGTIQSQTVTDESSSSFFKVTVGKYYTVSGKTPQQTGVFADIVVPSKYAFEEIGEAYLELAMNGDQIQETFDDDLKDIDPSLKQWYMRYYKPTLQRQEAQWRSFLEPLKLASEERLAKNWDYQNFIKNHDSKSSVEELQLQEALYVLEDMIDIRAQRYDPMIVENPLH
jgi:carboxyl-terminal processing protease